MTTHQLLQSMYKYVTGEFNSMHQKINKLDLKIDSVEKRLDDKIDGVEFRLTNKIEKLNDSMRIVKTTIGIS